jgi:hypothetical protein
VKDAVTDKVDYLGVDTTKPLADVRLLQKMLESSKGDMKAVDVETALRVLGVVSGFSDCSRLTSYLVQLMRHPSPQVRSKCALLLGRANLNLDRVNAFLQAGDGRLRANAVESLWGQDSEKVRRLLWEATRDSHGRVVINALLGLCKAGDREAFARLEALAGSPDPLLRSGAAWAMGEMGAAEFEPTLAKLEQDEDGKVQAMAARSRTKLNPPPDSAPGQAPDPPAA